MTLTAYMAHDLRRTLSTRRATKTETVAVHEAGHAVAAWALGWKVLSISTTPCEIDARTAEGHVTFKRPDNSGTPSNPRAYRQMLQEEITINLAGSASEHLAGAADTRAVSSGRDFRTAEGYMLLLTSPPEEEAALWQALWNKAEALLICKWSLVEAVTKSLLAHREVSGTQFAAIAAEVEETERKRRAHLRSLAGADAAAIRLEEDTIESRAEVYRLLPAHIRTALLWEHLGETGRGH